MVAMCERIRISKKGDPAFNNASRYVFSNLTHLAEQKSCDEAPSEFSMRPLFLASAPAN
jgi:hypothetical protein